MNEQKLALALIFLLACGLNAGASEIYKRINEDGVVEFSDRPSADGNAVEVRPNVVGTRQVQRPERRSATGEAARSSAPGRSAADPSTTSNRNISTTTRRDRAARANDRERREQRSSRDAEEDTATDPNPGRALRNAARNAPGGPR